MLQSFTNFRGVRYDRYRNLSFSGILRRYRSYDVFLSFLGYFVTKNFDVYDLCLNDSWGILGLTNYELSLGVFYDRYRDFRTLRTRFLVLSLFLSTILDPDGLQRRF